jgi:hypothetical protein
VIDVFAGHLNQERPLTSRKVSGNISGDNLGVILGFNSGNISEDICWGIFEDIPGDIFVDIPGHVSVYIFVNISRNRSGY